MKKLILRLRQPTLRLRLTLGMSLLLLVYTLLLAFSFEITASVHTAHPPTFVLLDEEQVKYAEIATQATLDYVREAVFRNLLFLTLAGAASAYWLAGRLLRPLHQIAHTARQVSAGSLDTRLTLRPPDDEIKQLTLSFNEMLDRLERTFEQQGRFAADAAHELRTPLTILRTSLDTLPPPEAFSPADYRELVQTFDRTLARLEKLVEILLLLTVEERRLPGEAVVLGPLLEAVIDDLAPLAKEKGVAVAYIGQAELTVTAEPALLGLVFTNLIENAIRYNRPGGRVSVLIKEEAGRSLVRIEDTGPGIPAEEQARIFDRFYRVDGSRAAHPGGAGLGLALVHHLVRLFGGQIAVDSTPGQGSTFTVTLPP